MESLDEIVLPWVAWINVGGLDLVGCQPRLLPVSSKRGRVTTTSSKHNYRIVHTTLSLLNSLPLSAVQERTSACFHPHLSKNTRCTNQYIPATAISAERIGTQRRAKDGRVRNQSREGKIMTAIPSWVNSKPKLNNKSG